MSLLVPDYIDRDIPVTSRERKAIRKEAWKLWMKDWRNVLIYLALVAVTIGLPMLPIWRRFVTPFIHNVWDLLLLMAADTVVLFQNSAYLQVMCLQMAVLLVVSRGPDFWHGKVLGKAKG